MARHGERSRSLRGTRWLALLLAAMTAVTSAWAAEVPPTPEDLARRADESRRAAHEWARRHGYPIAVEVPDDAMGRTVSLVGFRDGRPVYRTLLSAEAAITTATNMVHGEPYNLDGAGFRIGVWDGGGARETHVEIAGRAFTMDGSPDNSHATFVTGIIASTGLNVDAKGMAPGVIAEVYYFDDDEAEMLDGGAAYAGQPAKYAVSNHSYGDVAGWTPLSLSGNSGRHFVGIWDDTPPPESDLFGQYDAKSAAWDAICHLRPYFLPVKAIGNDRNETAPASGATFYRLSWDGTDWVWVSEVYDSSIHPPGDGLANLGYDTAPTFSTAKNVLTVGAVTKGVNGGLRDVSLVGMSNFSSWGPADDGRIKPDLVAAGVNVKSILFTSDTAYSGGSGSSGTSFSSPNVAGSAILLQEYHSELIPGDWMRASTLKALILHTADDLADGSATPGPDYSTGWGLMNTQAAADLIKAHADNPQDRHLVEDVLDTATPARTIALEWDGAIPIRATLCWTDPPGPAQSGIDNRTPVLVNDLDLRIVGPDSMVHFPFVLDVESPALAAARGDNTVDNVEQVLIDVPAPGTYTVQVSHKDVLSGGAQVYSLVLSGLTSGATSVGDWSTLDR